MASPGLAKCTPVQVPVIISSPSRKSCPRAAALFTSHSKDATGSPMTSAPLPLATRAPLTMSEALWASSSIVRQPLIGGP